MFFALHYLRIAAFLVIASHFTFNFCRDPCGNDWVPKWRQWNSWAMWAEWALIWRCPKTSSAFCRSRASSSNSVQKSWELPSVQMAKLMWRECNNESWICEFSFFFFLLSLCLYVFQSGGCCWREKWDVNLRCTVGLHWQKTFYSKSWFEISWHWAGQPQPNPCQSPLPD